jgi:hypothetical protein
MAVATLIIYFVFFYTCIPNHIHTMIQYIHPSSFAKASLLIALVLSGEKPPWGAEPRYELGPALQQASALPIELRCTPSGSGSTSCTSSPNEHKAQGKLDKQ